MRAFSFVEATRAFESGEDDEVLQCAYRGTAIGT